jgi:nucleoside-triphosphatase THEP1
MRNKILLTGLPRSGKTTLLRKLLEPVTHKTGFVTDEILAGGERVGFKMVDSRGSETVLADVSRETAFKVSRYYVDPPALDAAIEPLFVFGNEDLLYIDEIGEMELFSAKFKALVERYVDSGNPFIAAISRVYSDEFTKSLFDRTDVRILEVTPENRDALEAEARAALAQIL